MTHTFRHPKYYKEMRKLQAASHKHQASSDKQQAIDETVPHQEILEAQATEDTSNKRQAPSDKRQASSRKQQAAR